jgi:hypothetical protein
MPGDYERQYAHMREGNHFRSHHLVGGSVHVESLARLRREQYQATAGFGATLWQYVWSFPQRFVSNIGQLLLAF